MSSLSEKILRRDSGLRFYSFAPPKISTEADRLLVISKNQTERINNLNIDGLILYDIQDESHRTKEERIFPYVPTIAPEQYAKQYLTDIQAPRIIYKSIANHTPEMFDNWLATNEDLEHVVFVGASSTSQIEDNHITLTDACKLRKEFYSHLLLGGVTIPERHAKKGDEHHRLQRKKEDGCSFFVSQCVYHIHDTKNLLSDYYYDSLDNGYEMKPIILTLSPCGSIKTLEFMKWLGIDVPKWLYNDLKHAHDILQKSIDMAVAISEELRDYAAGKNIPIGFNIESISNKKDEIDAAVEILSRVR